MNADGRRRFWLPFVASWLLFSVLAALWALATPIGAAPDEPAHLIKAASVASGQFLGERGPNGQTTVQVPKYIAFSQDQTCYAFQPNVTANCIPAVTGDPGTLTSATTTAGLYNPVYYAIVGWPSLFIHDESGVYWMRIVSGVVTSLFLAIAFTLIAGWRRRTLPLIGFAAAATPMVLFLDGTVNPNTLEIAATLTTFVAMLTIAREPGSRRLAGRAVILLVSAAVVANMRGLSLLWLAFVILVPLLLLRQEQLFALLRRRSIKIAIAGVAVASVFALVWLLTSNSLGASISDPGVPNTAPGVGTSPIFGFIWTFVATFDYGQQVIGIFGWLDTPAPTYTVFVWSALIGGLVIVAIALLRRRALMVTAILLAGVILIPPILQGIYINKGGVIWQDRYILPLFVCLVVAAGTFLSDRIMLSGRTRTRLVLIVWLIWATAQFLSFATALRRYADGLGKGWQTLLAPHWSPPGDVFPILGAYAVVLALAVVGACIISREQLSPSLTGTPDEVGLPASGQPSEPEVPAP